jgi:hypothetical protein
MISQGSEDVRKRWRNLRIILSLPIVLFLVFLPIVGLGARLLGPRLWLVLAWFYVGIFVFSGYLSANWRCPNCGMPFNQKIHKFLSLAIPISLAYRSRCGSCGARGLSYTRDDASHLC